MNNVEETSKFENSVGETPDNRQAWQKPEAKVADVANATLNGIHARTAADLGSCES